MMRKKNSLANNNIMLLVVIVMMLLFSAMDYRQRKTPLSSSSSSCMFVKVVSATAENNNGGKQPPWSNIQTASSMQGNKLSNTATSDDEASSLFLEDEDRKETARPTISSSTTTTTNNVEDENDKFWQDSDDDDNDGVVFRRPKHREFKKRKYVKQQIGRFIKPLLSSIASSSSTSSSSYHSLLSATSTSVEIGITIRNYKRNRDDDTNGNHEKSDGVDIDNDDGDSSRMEEINKESSAVDNDDFITSANDSNNDDDDTAQDKKKKRRWNIQITGSHKQDGIRKQKRNALWDEVQNKSYDDEEEDDDDVMDDEMNDLTPLLAAFLKKRGEDLFHTVAAKVCSEETHQALKTIQKILSQFSDHGVIDVFSMYSTKDIILSTFALSRLQHCYIYTNERYTKAEKESSSPKESVFSSLSSWVDDYHDDYDYDDDTDSYYASGGATPGNVAGVDKKLLSDLAHYAVFANAAYGWKGGLALSGQVHIGDLNALLTKTGIEKEDFVTAQWRSKTNRPAFFLVRDVQRNKLVLSIRGTLSARDILTDLCCTADYFSTDDGADDEEEEETENAQSVNKTTESIINGAAEAFVSGATEAFHNTFRPKNKVARAHQGMLESARGVAKMTRKIIASELAARPNFNLVIVGHSLGGGVGAILGAMWETTFPGLAVYAYGCPCVGPLNASPTTNDAIVSVVGEGDPFSCLSLGHIADISSAISQLCRHHTLRDEILQRSRGKVENMSEEDLFYCYDAMEALRKHMDGEKFFPPGRILHMSRTSFGDARNVFLKEVSQDFFRDLKLHPRMLDLSRHAPIRYESALRRLWVETVRDEEVK